MTSRQKCHSKAFGHCLQYVAAEGNLTSWLTHNIIAAMKRVILLFLTIALACSNNKTPRGGDKFAQTLRDATTIGALTQLTSDERSIYQTFGPGDTIVFFERLVVPDPEDTFAFYEQERVRPYGIHIENGQLYTLSKATEFPSQGQLDPAKLPESSQHRIVYAVASPDSMMYAFEALEGLEEIHTIFLAYEDTVKQLSSGKKSCYLDRFSNTGRYLTAIYGNGPTWILIFDLVDGGVYRVPHDSTYIDYLTSFSSEDDMMLFIRSLKKYRQGQDFYGDIWVLEFGRSKQK
jgi:hypothetical protein